MEPATTQSTDRVSVVDILSRVAEAWGFAPKTPLKGHRLSDFYQQYSECLNDIGLPYTMNGRFHYVAARIPPPRLQFWACSRTDSGKDDMVGLRVVYSRTEEFEIRWDFKERKVSLTLPSKWEDEHPWLTPVLQALEAVPILKEMFLNFRWAEGSGHTDYETFVDFITDALVDYGFEQPHLIGT